MAISTVTTSDSLLNSYLSGIRSAEYGKDARSPMANAVQRCYEIAVMRAGGAKNGIKQSNITEHTNRIKTAVYGEEVRDALRTVLGLCYSARGISMSNSEANYLNSLIQVQTGEEFKNYILQSIAQCCKDVRA